MVRNPELSPGGRPSRRDLHAQEPWAVHLERNSGALLHHEQQAIAGEHGLLDLIKAERQLQPAQAKQSSRREVNVACEARPDRARPRLAPIEHGTPMSR